MNSPLNSPEELTKLCEIASEIAIEAGQEILKIYETEFSIERKDDKSPLTAADMASHHTICAGLAELPVQYPILSEESASIDFSERKAWETYWLVDPLDGTREFIKRNGEFTVNIALIHQQKPILGIVYVPVSETNYYGIKSVGAFKQQGTSTDKISTRKTDANHFGIAGSRSHGNERQQAFMNNVGDAEIIAMGSSLKFCLVAEGKVDIYPRFGPTSEWDSAAAQCVVEQAGGVVTTMDLKPLLYNTKESLLNPEFLVVADSSFDWAPYLP